MDRKRRMLRGNNSSVDDGSVFNLNAQSSLYPRKAYGSPTPTFTRATVATVTDFEGRLVTVPSGAARNQGGRFVRNEILSSSVDLSNASYTKQAAGTASIPVATANYALAPDGTMTASRVVMDRGAGTTGGDVSYISNGPGSTNANYKPSFYIKSNTGSNITLAYNGGVAESTFTVTTAWQRITAAGQWQVLIRGTHGTQVADILVWGAQAENTAGQSNQNPSEYVSVGAPAQVGPNLEVAIGNPPWSAVAGTTYGTGQASMAAVSGFAAYNLAGSTKVSGKTYIVTYTVSNYVSGSIKPYLHTTAVYGPTVSANGTYQAVIVANSTTGEVGFNAPSAFTGTISGYTVQESLFHGWGADGCKWFTYQNGNTVASNVVTEAQGAAISSTILKGYLSEPAGTNLQTGSNGYTTGWSLSNCTLAAAAMADPTGALNASTLTATATGTVYPYQTVIVGSTPGTFTLSTWTQFETSFSALVYDNTAANGFLQLFDSTTKTGTTYTARGSGWTVSSTKVTAYSGGWYKVSVTFVSTVTNIGVATFALNKNKVTVWGLAASGAISDTLTLFGAQLETGPVASSYTATTTVAVTRNVDLDSYVTSGNIPASGAFVIAGEFTPNTADTSLGHQLLASVLDGSNLVQLYWTGANISFERYIAGVLAAPLAAYTPVAGVTSKWVYRYSPTTGLDCWLDGVQGSHVASVSQPIFGTSFQLGSSSGSSQPYAALAKLTIIAADLSDSQCAALSQ